MLSLRKKRYLLPSELELGTPRALNAHKDIVTNKRDYYVKANSVMLWDLFWWWVWIVHLKIIMLHVVVCIKLIYLSVKRCLKTKSKSCWIIWIFWIDFCGHDLVQLYQSLKAEIYLTRLTKMYSPCNE